MLDASRRRQFPLERGAFRAKNELAGTHGPQCRLFDLGIDDAF